MLMDLEICLIVSKVQKSTIWGIKGGNNSPTTLFQISIKGRDKIMLTCKQDGASGSGGHEQQFPPLYERVNKLEVTV